MLLTITYHILYTLYYILYIIYHMLYTIIGYQAQHRVLGQGAAVDAVEGVRLDGPHHVLLLLLSLLNILLLLLLLLLLSSLLLLLLLSLLVVIMIIARLDGPHHVRGLFISTLLLCLFQHWNATQTIETTINHVLLFQRWTKHPHFLYFNVEGARLDGPHHVRGVDVLDRERLAPLFDIYIYIYIYVYAYTQICLLCYFVYLVSSVLSFNTTNMLSTLVLLFCIVVSFPSASGVRLCLKRSM